ncbi:hypothetical protein SARC_11884, partial [Sphaeroforma arctica JP610]
MLDGDLKPNPGTPVLEYLQHVCGVNSEKALADILGDESSGKYALALEALNGIRFRATHLAPDKKFHARGLGRSADKFSFEWKGNDGMHLDTVQSYFRK